MEVFKWYQGYCKGDIDKILGVSNPDSTMSNRFKVDKVRFLVRNTKKLVLKHVTKAK